MRFSRAPSVLFSVCMNDLEQDMYIQEKGGKFHSASSNSLLLTDTESAEHTSDMHPKHTTSGERDKKQRREGEVETERNRECITQQKI